LAKNPIKIKESVVPSLQVNLEQLLIANFLNIDNNSLPKSKAEQTEFEKVVKPSLRPESVALDPK
jgi:hypothetical protein